MLELSSLESSADDIDHPSRPLIAYALHYSVAFYSNKSSQVFEFSMLDILTVNILYPGFWLLNGQFKLEPDFNNRTAIQ
jgi:hypothetical protein